MESSSRRRFLTMAGVAVLGIGAKPVLDVLAAGQGEVAGSFKLQKGEGALNAKQWAMVIDTRKVEKASDLEPMISACHKIHNVPQMENKNHEIKWIWEEEYHYAFPTATSRYMNEHAEHIPFLCCAIIAKTRLACGLVPQRRRLNGKATASS